MLCNICPRKCGADRENAKGFCGEGAKIRAARAALHYWEEPVISGSSGSGAVFFSGCNLRCIYCQNRCLARGECGKELSPQELSEVFLNLEAEGAETLNLVTATHFTYEVALSLKLAKQKGLRLPVVWNSSAYECVKTLRALDGLIDVYLPDYKYAVSSLAKKYSLAADYPEVAISAISEMYRQVGKPNIENGIMKKGVIIRHLVLPNNVIASKIALKRLFSTFGNDVYYSIMRQYTPIWNDLPSELTRTLTDAEYRSVADYASKLGIENGFVQDKEAAKDSFIPIFDCSGL